MVVICGQNNYKLDIMHAINEVVVEITREGEVLSSSKSSAAPDPWPHCHRRTASILSTRIV
jgi:hypothetical protein